MAVLFYGISTLLWDIQHRIKFQTIQFSIRIVFIYKQLNVKTVLYQAIQFSISTVSISKTILFQTIQSSICIQFSSILPIDRTLSGATTPGLSGPGSDGNDGVLCIPQRYNISEALPSDCLVSCPGHSFGESYPSALIQLVHSVAPAHWAIQDTHWESLIPLQRYSRVFLQPQPTGPKMELPLPLS